MQSDIINDILRHLKQEGAITESVKPDDMLFESGILDSFGMVGLIEFLENQYGIQLTSDDLTKDNLETLTRIASLVEVKRSAR